MAMPVPVADSGGTGLAIAALLAAIISFGVVLWSFLHN